MTIENFDVSFSNTEKCLNEINQILEDIRIKLPSGVILNTHEELNRILLSKLIVQYTEEFKENARKLWNEVIKQYPKIHHYNDSKQTILREYITYTDFVVMIHGVKKYNQITESENYQICKKFWRERDTISHPDSKNIQQLNARQNNPETKLSLERFKTEDVLNKSIKLFQEIVISVQSDVI